MKNITNVVNEHGQEFAIEILIGFTIEEYNKNYIAYTINDDNLSENVQVVISEIVYDEDGSPKIVSIPDNEKQFVLVFYNNVKNKI